jgi:hypothetical protein
MSVLAGSSLHDASVVAWRENQLYVLVRVYSQILRVCHRLTRSLDSEVCTTPSDGSYIHSIYATIPRKAGLYSIGAYLAQAAVEPTVIKLTLDQLHRRLGHRNHKVILKMHTEGRLPGIKLTSRDITECRDCLLSKAAHAPIAVKRTSLLAAKFGDHVHLDIWGPATIRSLLEHAHYVLIIMDDATRWAEAPTMQHKSDGFAKYVAWEAHEELHSDMHVKINQSDHGGEFLKRLGDVSPVKRNHPQAHCP